MELLKVVEGKHNKETFRYEDGFLQMFGRKWDKADIQTLVEVANLLSVEGYSLKIPTGKTKAIRHDMFGWSHEVDVKTYDAESGEEA